MHMLNKFFDLIVEKVSTFSLFSEGTCPASISAQWTVLQEGILVGNIQGLQGSAIDMRPPIQKTAPDPAPLRKTGLKNSDSECVWRAAAVVLPPAYRTQAADASSWAFSSAGGTYRTPGLGGRARTVGCCLQCGDAQQCGDGQQLMLWCCRGNPARARLSTRWRLRRAVDGALPCATKRLQSIVLKRPCHLPKWPRTMLTIPLLLSP
ncbi:uncharacterized protein LOC125802535 [Astyanax mexicanus]|uniref:uncharacterized protein LOC125802535 n=1 Tax=Astyanax mexicanus TaxID=7994 RepID=UPI0020CB571A|nr:uncharacterized protein LOC125802535 [Astyanax mexicanus]